MTPTARRVAAALAAFAVLLLLSSCGGSAPGGHTDQKTDQPVITGQPASHNPADVAFATNMIAHHQQAVDLSAMVPDRSTTPGVIAMAKQIAAEQQPEINVIKVFLVQWTEGADNPPAPDAQHGGAMPGMVDDATITKLKASTGADFDKLWLESMIDHHQGAIEMANAEIANGENVDAKALAKNIVGIQEAEIAQMKQMQGG